MDSETVSRRLRTLATHSKNPLSRRVVAAATSETSPLESSPAFRALAALPIALTPQQAFPDGPADKRTVSVTDLAAAAREGRGSELGGCSQWLKIEQDRVDAFAAVTLDPQWIHERNAAARGSPFGGPIAHGFLSLSLCSQLAGQAIPTIKGVKMGINAGLASVRFVQPVPVGRRVRVKASIKDVEGPKDSPAGKRYKVVWLLAMELESKEGGAPEKRPAVTAEWITLSIVE